MMSFVIKKIENKLNLKRKTFYDFDFDNLKRNTF